MTAETLIISQPTAANLHCTASPGVAAVLAAAAPCRVCVGAALAPGDALAALPTSSMTEAL